MGIKSASFAVVSAAATGALIRLAFYPQFVIGALLLGSGLVIRLSSAWVGILIVLVSSAIGITVAVSQSDRIFHVLRKVSPKVAKGAVRGANVVLPKLWDTLKGCPPWLVTVLAFAVPALAQMSGSYSSIKILLTVKDPRTQLPSNNFVMFSSLVYAAVRYLGVSSSWTQPAKISFLLQTIWVAKTLMTAEDKAEVIQHMPSVLIGWGGVILSMLPDDAIMKVVQSAASAAAIAGSAAATVEGIKAIDGSSEDQQDESDEQVFLDDQDESTTSEGTSLRNRRSRKSTRSTASKRTSTRSLSAKVPTDDTRSNRDSVKSVTDEMLDEAVDSWRDWFRKVKSYDFASLRPSLSGWRTSPVSRDGEEPQTPEDQSATASAFAVNTDAIKEAAVKAGVLVKDLSPPVNVAFGVLLFRSFPTLIVMVMSIASVLIGTMSGKVHAAKLFVPLLLTPFAMTEVLTVSSKIRLAQNASREYNDGMALLLWQQPMLLQAWKRFTTLDEAATEEYFKMIQEPSTVVRSILNPSPDVVRATPRLSYWIVFQLVLSVLIDLMGIATYLIPGLGETVDLLLAPVSAYMIHHLYGVTALTWLGFVEEILPFTDFIPTATIGWFYTYGHYIPAWLVHERGYALDYDDMEESEDEFPEMIEASNPMCVSDSE